MTPPDAPTVERVRANAAAYLQAAADEVIELPWGWALRTPSLPHWYDLNMVLVEAQPADLDGERVAETVLDLLGGLPRMAVEVWPPAQPELCPPGWERDRFVLMVHAGPRPPAPVGVTEVARERVVDLRQEWLAGSDMPAWMLPEAARAEARLFTQTSTRAFAVLDGGAPVASALLVGDGAVRMVEDVYTTPAARGRGCGAAVVRAALAAGDAAGAEVLWLATDADGRALPLYERLGFEVAVTVARASHAPGA